MDKEFLTQRYKELETKELMAMHKLKVYRDENLIEFFNRPNPLQARLLEAWDDQSFKVFTFCGANRIGKCLSYFSRLDTPHGRIPIGELYKKGEPFDVFSWDGKNKIIVKASAPFKKEGLHKCYRVTMTDGSWVEAADHHRILTSRGWLSIQDVHRTYFSNLQETSLGHDQSIQNEDALHLNERGLNYQDHCFEDHHQNGGKPLLWSDIGQFFSPLQACVQRHGFVSYSLDELEHIYTNIRQSIYDLLSIQDGLLRNVAPFFESVCHNVCRTLTSFFEGFQLYPQPSIAGVSGLQLDHEVAQHQFFSYGQSSEYTALSYVPPLKVTGENQIKCITPISTLQEVYDFSVPVYKNYFAGGIVHHNTTIGTIIVFSTMFGYFPWNNKKIYFPHNKPRKVRYIGQDWEKQVKTVVLPELEKWWPKNRLVTKRKNNQGIDAYWKDTLTGSTLELMSNGQESELHEGWSGDLICIEENQRVLMGDGIWREIKNIEIGDEVWTISANHLRSRNKVLNKIDNGVRDIVKVKLVGGPEILCTPEHEIYVRSGSKNVRDKKKCAVDLTLEDRVFCPLVEDENHNRNDFYSIFDPILFIIGAWIGDGWIDKHRVFIATASDEFREYFIKCLPSGYKLVHRKRYDYEIQPSTGLIYYFLESLGLVGKKSNDKFIPDGIFTLDKKRKLEFIRGLLSTDGWAIKEGIGYASTSHRLVKDLGFLLNGLGIHSTIQFKKSQKEGVWRDQWFLMINKSASVIRLIEMITYVPGKNLKKTLEKAKSRYITRSKVFNGQPSADFKVSDKSYRRSIQYFRVKSVEPAGKARVYDLSIENNHNFICERMKVSNCYDEPPKRDIRVANARGLVDRKGRELFCMTLLKEAWVDREVIKAVDKDGYPDNSVFNIHGDISFNVGYGITQEGVDQFAKTLTDEEKEARLMGIPSYMSGLVYPNFSRKKHIVNRFGIPLDWVVDIAIDIHPRTQQAMLFCAVSPRGDKYLINEIWAHGDGNWVGEEIIRCVSINKYRVGRVIIDPLAKGDSNNTNSVFDKIQLILWRNGMQLEVACKDKTSGILEVKNHLMGPNNEPSLFIFNDLIRTIFEIEGYMYDKETQSPCVIGSTIIDTPSGQHQIKDIVGKEMFVYSYSNEIGRLDVKKASNIRKTGKKKEVWKLVMDRGILFATPDHLIMLRNGKYKELRNLKVYDSLMPLYRNINVDGYTQINPNDYRSKKSSQYPSEHRFVYECVYGNIPEGMQIHHKDMNYRNHNPENLELVTCEDHRKIHISNRVADIICINCGKKFTQNVYWRKHCSKECRQKYGDSRRNRGFIYTCLICGKEGKKIGGQKYCSVTCRGIAFRERRKILPSYNHKVLSVEFYGYEDVYDMFVDENHNFVANGIVVHNCDKDDHMMENLYRLMLLDTQWTPVEYEAEEAEGQHYQGRSAVGGY